MKDKRTIKREIRRRNAEFLHGRNRQTGRLGRRSEDWGSNEKSRSRIAKSKKRDDPPYRRLTLGGEASHSETDRNLESQRNYKRRSLFDAQDAVDRQRDTLIDQVEAKLAQRIAQKELFSVRWSLR